jgi:hypothetical protein
LPALRAHLRAGLGRAAPITASVGRGRVGGCVRAGASGAALQVVDVTEERARTRREQASDREGAGEDTHYLACYPRERTTVEPNARRDAASARASKSATAPGVSSFAGVAQPAQPAFFGGGG